MEPKACIKEKKRREREKRHSHEFTEKSLWTVETPSEMDGILGEIFS